MFFSFLLLKEKGNVKEWLLLENNDTLKIYYTLDKNLDRISENLFLFYYDIQKNEGKKKLILKNDKGISNLKIFYDTLNRKFYIFFSLNKKINERIIKPEAIYFIENKKIKKYFEVKNKKEFINKYDIKINKERFFSVMEIRSRIILKKNNEVKEIMFGISPLFFNKNIVFLKGVKERMNCLVKINPEESKNYEVVYDEEPVLGIKKQNNFLILLTDKDYDLLPERVILITKDFKKIPVYDSDKHIIILPSIYVEKNNIYILLCVSSQFTPDELLLIELNKDFHKKIKKILKFEGIEAKWVIYPFFVILKKTGNVSTFEFTSIK